MRGELSPELTIAASMPEFLTVCQAFNLQSLHVCGVLQNVAVERDVAKLDMRKRTPGQIRVGVTLTSAPFSGRLPITLNALQFKYIFVLI